ncbi:MAG: response regulator [Terriglobia bacterium]|jgi:DNA-binding NtrC family response regulator
MSEHLFALLIHDHPEPFASLKRTLRDLSVETYSVATCKEAEDLISQCQPHIVFTESSLEDGSWVNILNTAEASNVPLSVIVVGAVPDTRHYVSVMERGAFDFVAPPFEHGPLNFVIRSAALDAHRRRQALAHAVVAS